MFSTPGLAECEKRFNTLPPNVGIKSMWLKTHTASSCSVPAAPPAPGRGAAGPNQSPTSRCDVAYSDTPSRALHAPTKYAPAHVAAPHHLSYTLPAPHCPNLTDGIVVLRASGRWNLGPLVRVITSCWLRNTVSPWLRSTLTYGKSM